MFYKQKIELKELDMADIIIGDLLQSNVDLIVQQSNCLTVRPQGLALKIKEKLGIDPYSKRKESKINNIAIKNHRGTPGTIDVIKRSPMIFKNTIRPTFVCCLYGQYQPGKINKYPKYRKVTKEDGILETNRQREEWFQQGLNELKKWVLENNIQSIAFPYKIGCGLAGGKWANYYLMIINFAMDINDTKKIDVKVIELDK